ncbi:YoaK family protein [Facilibium subflavum]|uniref:YoaK family protein n=1 Tax=Facilibium subflavum TaxID=2219058 RepID=UPI000E645FBC|nr:YoaK family protein [Facilibium subflavum]
MKQSIPQSPVWVYFAAVLLPFNGGFINAATLVSFLHNSVGYVTGNIAYAGTYFAEHDILMFFRMMLLIFSFLIGAIISSLIVKSEYYHRDYRYRVNLMLQLMLVIVAMILLRYHIMGCEYLLAGAMGVQNAMTTHYGSALIRTTHMTGTTTDLGVLIAHWIKNNQVALWKIRLYLILILSFLVGAISGAVIFQAFSSNAFYVSISIYIIMIFLHKKQ